MWHEFLFYYVYPVDPNAWFRYSLQILVIWEINNWSLHFSYSWRVRSRSSIDLDILNTIDVRYFPKYFFPCGNFPKVFSQVAMFQMCNFLKPHLPKLIVFKNYQNSDRISFRFNYCLIVFHGKKRVFLITNQVLKFPKTRNDRFWKLSFF